MNRQYLISGYRNPPAFLTALSKKREEYWIERGEKKALLQFHSMSNRIPAYKDFLKKNKITPQKIKTIDDFKKIPTISKDNYLRVYPIEKLCWDGKFNSRQWIISATSGSTGEPFYFPRQQEQDYQYAFTAELYLRTNFQIHKRSTLYINAFPMGIWIGGLFTYQAIQYVAQRGNYPLSIICPGINKLEVIKTVKNLGHHFEQIIIGCYAPFLKDIIDDGINLGLDWKKYNLKFIFSAEGFSETFRDYIMKKTGFKSPYLDTLNHYGTVDLGTMSCETPLSILLRRLAIEDNRIYKEIFSDTLKLPTLTQFIPEMFFFESAEGKLICSAFSGFPLVRYDLKDNGGVFTLEDISSRLKENGVDILERAKEENIQDTIWNLPFVYVYERSDFSVSFFAFQIYPETVRKALQDESLEDFVTGKFTMLVRYDDKADQIFEVNVEMKSGAKESLELKKKVEKLIFDRLMLENSEFRKTNEEYPGKTKPHIVLWEYENPTYFKPGTKQKWVKKYE